MRFKFVVKFSFILASLFSQKKVFVNHVITISIIHYHIITSKRYLFIMSMITDPIGRQEVLFPIEHKNYNFRERENNQVKLSSVMIG